MLQENPACIKHDNKDKILLVSMNTEIQDKDKEEGTNTAESKKHFFSRDKMTGKTI